MKPYIDPGERQSLGPNPPACIGPFDHISPSELDKATKNKEAQDCRFLVNVGSGYIEQAR